MPFALDHIVIAVADLQAAIADYRALGLQVLTGGQHPGRTSHNALVVFADGAYLELIAWRAPAPEERWYRTLRDHGEGLVDFALRAPDTVQALADARARGLGTLTGPVDGGRLRPDGAQLRWQTARHATPDVPFLCGDITPRALRVPEGAARVHPNGAEGAAALTVAVHDLDATLARYQALLGAQAQAATLASAGGIRTARLPLGSTLLWLQSPERAASAPGAAEPPAAQALRERLASRGEGPCALVLRRRADTLPPGTAATHGVALQWLAAEIP
ncbi:VOC family protein [Acidovorax sp. sif1233]|uniref:VOC family protein n=1 Tax=Acidovorax sp. sif1233 TaxID=2854792 RepID=UPI001C469C30|nr:VOC family protein [Acidovorax sp. sif1233]MBV7456671.1 VOC family protein [Acidovorax sp. sif1233]